MTTAQLDDFIAAIADLTVDDYTSKGAPKMDALNARLHQAGFEPISANQRDEFMDQIPDEDDPEDAASMTCRILVAPMDPVPIRMAGKLLANPHIGEEFEATEDILEILTNSSIAFEMV